MPAKKKSIRRKKKFIRSSCYIKRDLKKIYHENVLGDSSHNEPCELCKNGMAISKNKTSLKKIHSPFNRFANNNSPSRATDQQKSGNTTSTYEYQSNFRPSGLSPKEKCYVISNCQSRSSRYIRLKKLAVQAMENNKIFSIYGSCNEVRKALIERGWIEKILPSKMNLLKIKNGTISTKAEVHSELERLLLSNLVEKCTPNFVWRTRDEYRNNTRIIDMAKAGITISNKLKIDALWTSKQGLCSSMKRNYWFYIEDVAEVNGPRTYNSYDVGEVEEFVKDYKITACTSLLKWVLSMVANERPVFVNTGKVSMNVIVFALNRCKEYLDRKQHKDIDGAISSVSSGQWNAFLRNYYQIIAKDAVFQVDTNNTLSFYLRYAKCLLKDIHRYRPQLSCEGCHNIWIIKPAHCSRGRGIRMASKLVVISELLNKANSKYVVQKYIEEPLLIYNTKFDIRQYYLVTSTYPLIIWMYADCYLKFSSQKYNLRNYHESIHLTNNAVQRKYTNCTGRHKELPKSNMWHSEKYKDYLTNIGMDKVWDNIIYPGMKKSIIGIMLSCQDSLSVCKNRFELYGCDFILDNDYKPWLIEINSCPDLNHTTQITAKICPAVISDVIKVVIDHAQDPNSPTGRFECIYRQPMSTPRYGCATDLAVRGSTLPLEYFYRGNIKIKENYENTNIDKEINTQFELKKIEKYLNDIIIVEPEDDSDFNRKSEEKVYTRITHSEYDLSLATTVITELNEIMDRTKSDNSFSIKFKKNKESVSSLSRRRSSSPDRSPKTTKSVINISSLIVNSCGCFASSGHSLQSLSVNHLFHFSKLDDGPLGKRSIVLVNNKDIDELSLLINLLSNQ